ncbi:MAG: ABC transporter permease [Bacteroidota bacterium]
MNENPPKYALKFLRWFCREDYLEEIEGDLMEVFEKQYKSSPKKAKWEFTWSVIRCFRPEFIKSFKSSYHPTLFAMLCHSFLLAFRTFKRYKSSFFINLVGLSTGLAAVLLIYLWVYDELSVDKFHKNDQKLYQVLRNLNKPNGIKTSESNSDLLAPSLIEELGEIEYVVPVVDEASSAILSFNKKKIKASGKLAGKDFFKVFSFELIQGDKDIVLADKNAIVISKELAASIFDSENDVIGKIINVVDNTDGEAIYADDYIVSGVFDIANVNTSEQFDFLLTNKLYLDKRDPSNKDWGSNNPSIYITIKEGVDIDQFNSKINDFYRSKLEPLYGENHPEWIGTMFTQRYSERYLNNYYENGKQAGGRINYVILFSVVAIIILMIACINFMNLSTAQASRRLKEVGIKKTIGVSNKVLVFQYIGESMMLVFISSLIAVLLVLLLLPQFNVITGKQLAFTPDINLISGALFIIILTGCLSGSYPAFFLSRLKPNEVLKAKLKKSIGEIITRRGLVIFQFSISIILIVSVMVITKQIDFVQSKSLGYEKDNILTFEKEGKLIENIESFLQAAKNTVGIINASVLEGSISNFDNSGGGYGGEGRSPIQYTFTRVGYDYIKTLNIELLQGRSFSRNFNNEGEKIILNETAIKAMGLADPIGKVVNIRGEREIIGIVKDFHFQSLYEEIKPMFLIFLPEDANTVVVKIQAGEERETITRLEKLYDKFNPGVPFEFRFLDEEYQAHYISEQRVANLAKYFSVIAILISCLGLFGLAAFTAERRLKEIGIRKVLGASNFGIIHLLSNDFTKMVLVAIIIALPISYFIAQQWLESFAFRIDLEWWYFAGAGFIALLIAWITVGLQTVKAATINPIKCLKDE